jgi:hypothetical protein
MGKIPQEFSPPKKIAGLVLRNTSPAIFFGGENSWGIFPINPGVSN